VVLLVHHSDAYFYLNPAKNEVFWCSSARCQHQIPTGPACVGDIFVPTVRTIRDLEVYTDADVTMSTHVTAIIKACFAALCQICSVRRSLTRTTLLTLIHALVDYCSSVLLGISGQLLQRLRSVFNAAARLVFSARKSEHITPLLRELHWLKVPEIIQFWLHDRAYHCLNGTAPSYLAETLHLTLTSSECFNVDTSCTVHMMHHAG